MTMTHAGSPPDSAPCAPLIVDEQPLWDRIAPRLRRASHIAVDMESNGFHAYRDRICLIQIATEDLLLLLDPLRVTSLDVLGKIFSNRKIEKIFHSADYDLRSFDRDYGFAVNNLFDTAIAAGFLGHNMLGLGSVTMRELGIELPKSKAMQRRNWAKRPLDPEPVRYAAHDVCHLLRLRDRQVEQLTAFGRLDWVREECDRLASVRYVTPAPPAEACLQTKGFNKLTPPQRSIFRELFVLRDHHAEKKDIPPFKLISSTVLFDLARQPKQDLSKIHALNRGLGRLLLRNVPAAIERGLAAEPIRKGNGHAREKPEAGTTARLNRLKTWRKQKAGQHQLDPALVWPMKDLEFLARTDARSLDVPRNDEEPSMVRRWQRSVFGDSLEKTLCSAP